jgi:hypothetical protein
MSTIEPRSGRAERPPRSFWERVQEIDMFFAGNDKVHETMRRLAGALEDAGISYAIAGGMAVNAHHYQRTTADVDFLLTPEGFQAFRDRFVGKDFDPVPKRSKRFVDRSNGVSIDILVTGLYPGSGKPGPIAHPDPADVGEVIDDARFVNLVTLVTMKLAARRHRDFGDVVELIRFNDLDESFADRLHPTLRDDYIECLEEKRREDEYEAREG